ncbi:MAG: stage III sporulation protein AA [Clostridioides sp.]|nr:stage III sporulation protein AA [Clostridioides sp.]
MNCLPENVTNSLSQKLREILEKSLQNSIIEKNNMQIEEIRLRVNSPMIINSQGRDFFINKRNKRITEKLEEPYNITMEDIEQSFQIMCKYSIYSFLDDIKKGFITLKGGHRVGIMGKVIIENGQVANIKHISSLNIRISREIIGCSDKILKYIVDKKIFNTIIISPPQCGKTTLLRDIVRNLSNGNKNYNLDGMKVCVIDERNEISGSYLGISQMNIGIRTDILDSCPKDIGIMMILRAMSPNVIVTDEIGSEKEIASLYTALNGGVNLITTVHGNSIEDILHRKELRKLLNGELFQRVIVLSAKNGPGTVKNIYEFKELKWCSII